jgi:alpha-tubulin suppressor-like RCC1 family protein
MTPPLHRQPTLAVTVAVLVAAGVASLAGCARRSPYVCTSNAQCVEDGERGICGPDGFCAFADPACPAGFRYEPNAGAGLGGLCVALVDAGPPDRACGAVGQSCCAGAQSCADGACRDGTCQSCIAELVFGRRFGCVLRTDRTVWCSGDNRQGQLGSGIVGIPSATHVQVRDGAGALTDAIAIGAGAAHACAVRADGSVWCWGDNSAGELGNNTTALSPVAVQVQTTAGQPLTGIVEVRGGDDHTCARDAAGQIWCWGENNDAELGDATTVTRGRAAPVLVAAMGAPFSGAVALAIGEDTSCVRRANDEIWCWGENDTAELGDGTLTNRGSPLLLGTFTTVAMGMAHVCRLHRDTGISCSGENRHAVFGNGTGEGNRSSTHSTPIPVLASPGGAPFIGAVDIAAAGGSAGCALMQDTGVYCWGDGQYGQVGTGRPERVPAAVRDADGTPLTGIDRLVAGYPHVCARRQSGEWVCWGRNSEGELGDGTFVNRAFPAPLQVKCP